MLLKVFCVIQIGCDCGGCKKISVILATDSLTHARNVTNEHNNRPFICEECGNVHEYQLDQAEFRKIHHVYKEE